MIHSSAAVPACRLWPIEGTATLTMVVSSRSITKAQATAIRAAVRRRGVKPAAAAKADSWVEEGETFIDGARSGLVGKSEAEREQRGFAVVRQVGTLARDCGHGRRKFHRQAA